MNISVKAKLDDLGINITTLEESTIEAFRTAVAGVAKASQAEWIRLAQNRLKTSRQEYINGLRKAESFKTRVEGTSSIFEIQLVGKMPNSFEFGMDSFDMKSARPGWLGGSKAKVSKDGNRYITIPFRHSLSSAATLAYSGKASRENLKKELRKTVKKYGLDRMVKLATGKPASGSVARVPKGGETHRYLKGLTRIQKPLGGKRASGQLFTWRVMSENSDPGSWVHPGLSGAKLLPEVGRWADREMDNIIKMIMEASS